MKGYNPQFVARTAYNQQSDAYNWQRICLYHSISVNAENQEETLTRNSQWYQIKEGKFNEKDNEMVQLTKIILKQMARHNEHEIYFRRLKWRAM